MDLCLPTEAQWEYAARAGTSTVWWGGNDRAKFAADRAGNIFDQSAKNGGYSGDAEAWDDHFDDAAPVGEFAPNPFGLHDVLGNVWEWCEDEYANDYAVYPARPDDGLRSLPAQEGPRLRVSRGGSWDARAELARCAHRERVDPSFRSDDLGLRPARAVTK
jgi:formylglycine-generating enzyme required for sulfatase activity